MKFNVSFNPLIVGPFNAGRVRKLLAKKTPFCGGVYTLESYLVKYAVGKTLITSKGPRGAIAKDVPYVIFDVATSRKMKISKLVHDTMIFTPKELVLELSFEELLAVYGGQLGSSIAEATGITPLGLEVLSEGMVIDDLRELPAIHDIQISTSDEDQYTVTFNQI